MINLEKRLYRCGPLIRMWCMRYEAKHSYFRKMAHVIHNFKNVAKSLATHHQSLMCYHMSDPSEYLKPKTVYGKGKSLSIHVLFINLFIYFLYQ